MRIDKEILDVEKALEVIPLLHQSLSTSIDPEVVLFNPKLFEALRHMHEFLLTYRLWLIGRMIDRHGEEGERNTEFIRKALANTQRLYKTKG